MELKTKQTYIPDTLSIDWCVVKKSPRCPQEEDINSEFKNTMNKVGWLMVKQQASNRRAVSTDLNFTDLPLSTSFHCTLVSSTIK